MNRKSILCICLSLSLAASIALTSCSDTQEIGTMSSNSSVISIPENVNSKPLREKEQTLLFQINSNFPIYKCNVSINNDLNKINKIEITENETGDHIQTIMLKDNELFTNSLIYFVDVTFTGCLSLIIPYEKSSHYIVFDAYVWDNNKNIFVESPSFRNIYNPTIDFENKRILSKNSSNQITSYNMFSYQDDQFILTNSVYWEPNYVEGDDESNLKNINHFVEKDGDNIVLDTYVSGSDSYTVDINNPQITSYFVAGSFWDLYSPKWQCMFFNQIIS